MIMAYISNIGKVEKEDIERHHLRLEDQLPPLEVLVTREAHPVVTRRELTVITGGQKTFKTHIHQSITAAVLSQKRDLMFSAAKDGLRVMVHDTEQNPARIQMQYNALVRSIGMPIGVTPEGLNLYSLLGLSVDEKRIILDSSISKDCPDIVIIDGVADFVNDVNDYSECDRLVKHLQELALNNDCAIICLIHLNPGSSKERGHLGTILRNKTTGYIILSRTGDIVKVSAGDVHRDSPFDDFYVAFDESSQRVVEVPSSTPTLPNYTTSRTPKTKKLDQYVNAIPACFTRKLFGRYEPMKTREIETLLIERYNISERNRNEVTRAIKRACETGLIAKTKRGEYELKQGMTDDAE